MDFNMEQFLSDYGIETAPRSNKHYRIGWVNIHCPFCEGVQNYHLGWNKYHNYWNCYRCDYHQFYEVIMTIFNMPYNEARSLCSGYWSGVGELRKKKTDKIYRNTKLKLPHDCGDLLPQHAQYLEERNFDPHLLIKQWGIMATGLFGTYSHRIVIPIKYKERMVSYTSRDITGQTDLRYKACADRDEVIPHKHLLYGWDEVIKYKMKKIILVEGVTDVWRLGIGSLATFGTGCTEQQLKLLEQFEKVILFFDPEKPAQKKARQIRAELDIMGIETQLITQTDGRDPAQLTQKESNQIIKKYILK